jgi:hypothetical protein
MKPPPHWIKIITAMKAKARAAKSSKLSGLKSPAPSGTVAMNTSGTVHAARDRSLQPSH